MTTGPGDTSSTARSTPPSRIRSGPCLEKLDRYVHWEIDHVDGKAEEDGFPERLIREGYKNVILEDKERWDGASIEQIREDFKDLLASRGAEIGVVVPRYAVCLAVDQHCLDSIMNAFEDPEERGGGPGKGFVLMIEPECSPGHREDGYFGFMRVEIDTLFWLTVELNSSTSMSEMCRRVQPGKIPVYDGGLGYAVDDPSWTGPRPVTPLTHRDVRKGDCREHLGMQP
ncbi:hypothetical protein CNMCM5793_000795 [Aspergillus hiratsukae]|uniref:Uncharacterized protein n=1 Tax=Aspergillus hiratsukae TaxID=1194566 RepID=A0A8H6USP8_9EURO|nr:hypothetical protein CNMCM5793_000795 [Aspergillus hiratsukae]KAF7162809.1 hypothetical protein CNMCM6106_009582 [Aspergillus hiratsukae]